MTALSAINALESRCLPKRIALTTAAELKENGREESRKYYAWLRQQAPMTAMGLPMWEDLERKPSLSLEDQMPAAGVAACPGPFLVSHSTHGGSRPNSGRKPKPKPATLSLRIPHQLLTKWDTTKRRLSLSGPSLLAKLLE